jgi:hypothetical protein
VAKIKNTLDGINSGQIYKTEEIGILHHIVTDE